MGHSHNLDLTKAMNQLLLEYGDAIRDAVNDALPKIAKETISLLRVTSPRQTGAYGKDWKLQKWSENQFYTGVTVFNDKHYQLTHLLEYEHDVKNKKGGPVIGKTKAHKHIEEAEKIAGERLIREIQRKVGAIK